MNCPKNPSLSGGQLPGTPGVTVVTFTGVVVPGTKAIFLKGSLLSLGLIKNPNKSEKSQVKGLFSLYSSEANRYLKLI